MDFVKKERCSGWSARSASAARALNFGAGGGALLSPFAGRGCLPFLPAIGSATEPGASMTLPVRNIILAVLVTFFVVLNDTTPVSRSPRKGPVSKERAKNDFMP